MGASYLSAVGYQPRLVREHVEASFGNDRRDEHRFAHAYPGRDLSACRVNPNKLPLARRHPKLATRQGRTRPGLCPVQLHRPARCTRAAINSYQLSLRIDYEYAVTGDPWRLCAGDCAGPYTFAGALLRRDETAPRD